jgi:hypothetical protein
MQKWQGGQQSLLPDRRARPFMSPLHKGLHVTAAYHARTAGLKGPSQIDRPPHAIESAPVPRQDGTMILSTRILGSLEVSPIGFGTISFTSIYSEAPEKSEILAFPRRCYNSPAVKSVEVRTGAR